VKPTPTGRAHGRDGGQAHHRRQHGIGAGLRVRGRDGADLVSHYAFVVAGRGVDHYLEKLRTDPETGEATFAIVQAEDELAAIGMAIGAGWAGARAMTARRGRASR
jgi:hypothetical protein